MGTEISLSLGGADLAWSKNHRGMDHGSLFQERDRKPVRCDQINYEYYEDEGLDPTPYEMAFASKLGDMLPRLELLGYTLALARVSYEKRVETWREERAAMNDDDEPSAPDPLGFDDYLALATRYPLVELDDSFVGSNSKKAKRRFKGEKEIFARLPLEWDFDDSAYSERSYFASAVDLLHPYLMLRIFAENPTNRDSDVIWQYGPLVENGWAETSEFNGDVRRTETFLVATEGSSDAHILQHALTLLRPGILDFFRFIDVSERHPFSGTGNLVKFAEGLAKIDVHNQTVFLFDNDAEGVEAFHKVESLNLPPNMRAMLLPDIEAFRDFPTKGPNGEQRSDINGRGAAIECYLDHRLHNYPPPRVVWTNYKRDADIYHGALEHKESYAKAFLALRSGADQIDSYDMSKVNLVLDALVAECVSIAQTGLVERWELPAE
jgi:hypothetical protein